MLGQLMTDRRIERVLGFGTADAHDGDAVDGIFQQHDWIGGLAHLCSGLTMQQCPLCEIAFHVSPE
jgi:hypothetical protein